MTNINVETQAEILALFYSDRHSIRWIARKYGINRISVRRITKRKSVLNDRAGRTNYVSILDSYKNDIDQILAEHAYMTGTAVMNRLRELGYTGGITVVRDYLRIKNQMRVRPKAAFLRLEFNPGEVAQVDWGEFGDVFGDGIKHHCFAMVLAHSRYVYLEFTKTEKFEDFIRCHENAFKYFGGVPRSCWYDNLATAVTERVGQLIKFNVRFVAYMGHHHVRPHACNVARGNEKGRVEDLIKYIRMNFWPGRKFEGFDDLNQQAARWRDEICNQREHRSTKQIPKLHFLRDEKPKLMAMNQHAYDTDEILSRVVPNDFHIIYETNRYSVPWTLSGIAITMRVDQKKIRIYYDHQFVTEHTRSFLKNKVFTIDLHQKGLLDQKPGVTREAWQVAAVKSIGPKMKEYIDLLKAGERSLRAELMRILALQTVYGDARVHDACQELLSRGIIGVASLEISLKAKHHPSLTDLNPTPITFKENEKLNRVVRTVDLRRYDTLILESIKTKSGSEKDDDDDGIINRHGKDNDDEEGGRNNGATSINAGSRGDSPGIIADDESAARTGADQSSDNDRG